MASFVAIAFFYIQLSQRPTYVLTSLQTILLYSTLHSYVHRSSTSVTFLRPSLFYIPHSWALSSLPCHPLFSNILAIPKQYFVKFLTPSLFLFHIANSSCRFFFHHHLSTLNRPLHSHDSPTTLYFHTAPLLHHPIFTLKKPLNPLPNSNTRYLFKLAQPIWLLSRYVQSARSVKRC